MTELLNLKLKNSKLIENLKFKIKNSRRGFTLVEVLTVVALIGILVTIAFLSLRSQRQRAQVAAAVASVKGAMTPATLCKSLDGEIQAPAAGSTGGDTLCEGSSEIPESIKWPVLSNNCRYCSLDGTRVEFNCGACGSGSGGNSFCDFSTTQCETRN
jgi:prepilin-type N-terminal cleavage/methylation domain-containing protein